MIVAKIHGMNGICTTESLRKDFVRRVVEKLEENNAENPKDILLSFSGDCVVDGEGKASSFCIVHVSPAFSTKDLILLVKILKQESSLDNRIKVSNLGPVPIDGSVKK